MPDVPVSKFVLNMKGGKKSLLVNSTNTCAKPQRAVLNIKGQNGKKVKNNKFKLNIASCRQEARSSAALATSRSHRRGWPNSLRAGAPDALSPDRRLEQPRRARPGPFPPCSPELGEGDELIVVDNDSGDGTAEVVAELAPAARIVRIGRNAGFAGGCNAGAAAASGDLLVILNPDAAPLPGFGEAIRRPWREGRGWAAWQALVADGGGDDDQLGRQPGPLHRHRLGRRPRRADRRGAAGRRGAGRSPAPAWRSRWPTWREVGGFPERVLPLPRGRRPLAAAAAGRRHASGSSRPPSSPTTTSSAPAPHKWRWLERNRLAFLVRTYPAPLLVAAGPGPARHRAGAARSSPPPAAGAGRSCAANLEVLRWLPRLLRERRQIQRQPHRQRRRVRLLAHPRPRLPLHRQRGPLPAGPPWAARLLVSGSASAPPPVASSDNLERHALSPRRWLTGEMQGFSIANRPHWRDFRVPKLIRRP